MSLRDRRKMVLLGSALLGSVLVAGACSDTSTTPQAPSGSSGQTGAAGAAGTGVGGGGAGTGTTSGGGGAAGSTAASSGTAGSGQAGSSLGGTASTAGAAGAGGVAGTSAGAGNTGGAVGTGCKGATVCYDFETCTTPTGWTVPTFNEGHMGAGSTLVDNEKAHDGTCSLHMKDFSGDQPQHAYVADLPGNFGPVLWGSAWVYSTSAPTQHGALIKTRYAIANSADQDWYEVGYELQNYNGQWHNPLPPSGLPEWILRSSTPIGINTWQCVEWQFDAQNGNQPQAADPRIWVDGQEIVFGPGIEYDLSNAQGLPRPTTPKGNNFVSIEVGLTMYHQLDEKTQIYLDNLAFGKERVGCKL
jgi:hypothetical protein